MRDDLISHIGIAVTDLEKSIRSYELLTASRVGAISEVADQKVRVAMFGGHGRARIELVAPTSPDSPIARFLQRRGEGLHHVCVYVDDLDKRLSELRAAGVRLIDEQPRVGADGNRIAFVHPLGAGGVLVELEERAT
jgi:methylmalonyl-CoA/ethylmalonyl-CoA epimerase